MTTSLIIFLLFVIILDLLNNINFISELYLLVFIVVSIMEWNIMVRAVCFLVCCGISADGVKNITAYRAISVAASTRCSGHFLACPS